MTGFVKFSAGLRWPVHQHLGQEYMLVLSGGFRQDDGLEVHAGTLHPMPEGSQHGFTIFDDEPCISAILVWGGVDFKEGDDIVIPDYRK
jgi:putative transcriptional regulator